MEALQIVRENMLDEDYMLDEYTISCFFWPCACKDMGFWSVGDGLCDRCQEIEYVHKDDINWQLLYNAITCVCRM